MEIIDSLIQELDELSIDLHFDVTNAKLDEYEKNIRSLINKCEILKNYLIK